MKSINQQIASANALALVRGIENATHLACGVDRSLAQLYRHPCAPVGTPRRKHKITDRRQRKLDARYREHAAVYATFAAAA
jgi:hypothetical protein